ncbi:MAG: hypothetical protein Q4Q22_03410 [Methanosphaera sp.]|nr:hypothetical protein [Methanosphaera sp.]
MREKSLLIICITAVLCTAILSATIILAYNQNGNDDSNKTNSTNITLNQSNNTTNNTSTQSTEKTSTTSEESTDPDYDPTRDASHKYATVDNPVTVQQSDGEYTYYGPGHYDYYAGGNHMSGGYYKERNKKSY